jgi:hypothetical protein
MKTTKRRSITMLLCSLALMLVMYNCKKKDADPLTVDPGLAEEMNNIKLETVPLAETKPVVVEPSKIELSAQSVALAAGLADMAATGVVPESVKAGSAAVTGALSPTEITAMSSVSSSVLDAIKAGGALPADLKAIMDKAAANPALSAYLPVVTLPKVGGQEVGGRIGVADGVSLDEAIEAIMVTDACLADAEAKFQAKKTELDAARDAQLVPVATRYAADIALIAPAQAACTAALPAKYAALRTAADANFNTLNTLLDASQAVLGADYATQKVQLFLGYIGYLSSLNTLQTADTNACTATAAQATTNAQAARDESTAAITAAYTTALAAATAKRAELTQSCHNQGGGQ